MASEKMSLFLLEGLSEQEQNRFLAMLPERERLYRRGETVYDSALAERALVWVLEGRLRVLHGRVVMNDLRAGDVFGAAALFGGAESYSSVVEAVTDCRLRFIPQETVSTWMRMNPQVGEGYVRFLSGRIRFLNGQLATLTAADADERLWRYLRAHGEPGGEAVHLPGGMTALAEHLGIGRSSLYRSLDALAAAGRIRREGRAIYLI